MKTCSNCSKKKKIVEFRETCDRNVIEYNMCFDCRELGEALSRKALGNGTRLIATQAGKLGLHIEVGT